MADYYSQFWLKIEQLMSEEKTDEVLRLVNEELSMPYIPMADEDRLRDLAKSLKKEQVKRTPSLEELVESIKNSNLGSLASLDQLRKSNLRLLGGAIQDMFDSSLHPLIATLLIQICIEQQLTETFVWQKDGQRMEFIPMYLPLPWESDGYIAATQFLREWLENDNPSLLKMCVDVLDGEATLALPLSFSEEEGMILAASVLKFVYMALNDVNEWRKAVIKFKIEEPQLFEISGLPEF
ncbi:MAG: hypothetical protein Q8N92_02055, partial [Erysipelotrichaceae bacterium]|nr:hypothetical protein [Erysipelotrichaceae bacterium]